MDKSMERKFLKTTVAGILLEIGFQVVEPAALETLVEMLFSGEFYFPIIDANMAERSRIFEPNNFCLSVVECG
jgi:hypothetical protein